MKKMNIYYITAIIFTLLAMIFSYLSAKKDGEDAEIKLKTTISEQTTEIKFLRNIISNISNSTDELTAKGSYPMASFDAPNKNGNSQVAVFLKGKYAIKNLTVKVVSIPDYYNVSGLDLRITGINSQLIELGTLKSNYFPSFYVENKSKKTAIIFYFSSDNESWTQTIRTENNKSKSLRFSTIYDKNGTLLNKYMNAGFPLTADKKVVLWSNLQMAYEDIK